jgi:hypothetical protein
MQRLFKTRIAFSAGGSGSGERKPVPVPFSYTVLSNGYVNYISDAIIWIHELRILTHESKSKNGSGSEHCRNTIIYFVELSLRIGLSIERVRVRETCGISMID